MSKSIEITRHQWQRLFERIKIDHKTSTWSIRENMKKRLGFLCREHNEWGSTDTVYYLDFFDDGKKTMFLLKYGEYLNDHNTV